MEKLKSIFFYGILLRFLSLAFLIFICLVPIYGQQKGNGHSSGNGQQTGIKQQTGSGQPIGNKPQTGHGQQTENGTFIFKIEYLDSIKSHTSSQMALPSKVVSVLSASESRTDVVSSYGSSASFLDFGTRTYRNYISISDKKIEIRGNMDSLISKSENRNAYTFQLSTDTQLVHGLLCKKAVAHFLDGQIPDATILYCPSIPSIPNPITLPFMKLKGLIIDMVSQYQGISIHLKLEDFSKIIDSQVFILPSGYTEYGEQEALLNLSKP